MFWIFRRKKAKQECIPVCDGEFLWQAGKANNELRRTYSLISAGISFATVIFAFSGKRARMSGFIAGNEENETCFLDFEALAFFINNAIQIQAGSGVSLVTLQAIILPLLQEVFNECKTESFEKFYKRQLEELKLVERTGSGLNINTYLVSTHWFFNLLPRLKPLYVGAVDKKPEFENGVVTGFFQGRTSVTGLVWKLAAVIEERTGVESEIRVDTQFPFRR